MRGAVSFRRMGPLDLLAPETDPLLGGPPPRNAYVELHNLIAAAERPSEFGPADRDRISERWGVDLASSFLAERIALYQAVLDDRLADGDLDGDDRDVVAHVARTLGLSAADLRPAHERAFGVAVEGAISDDCLSVEERLLLYTLQHTLGLDPRLADGAYDVFARKRLLSAVARVLCDGEVTPAEAEEIERVRGALSVDVPDRLRALLAEASARWQARHGTLPRVRVGIGLQSGETGHFWSTGARWQPVNGTRLRAASDDHRRALQTGRTGRLRVPEMALHGRTDVGDVVVTDRRLVLLPARGGEVEHALRSLSAVFRFSNGVVVRTEGDRWTFLDTEGDEDALHTVLARLLAPAPPPSDADGEVFFKASHAWWRHVDEGRLRESGKRLRTALDTGATAGLRVSGDGLSGRASKGEVAVTDRALVLTSGRGGREEVLLAEMRPPLLFRNGVLVRAGRRAVLVDVGGRSEALHTTLRRALASPD